MQILAPLGHKKDSSSSAVSFVANWFCLMVNSKEKNEKQKTLNGKWISVRCPLEWVPLCRPLSLTLSSSYFCSYEFSCLTFNIHLSTYLSTISETIPVHVLLLIPISISFSICSTAPAADLIRVTRLAQLTVGWGLSYLDRVVPALFPANANGISESRYV